MKYKYIRIMISLIVIIAVISAIVVTNITYADYYKPTQITNEYDCEAYSFRVDHMEVLDKDDILERYGDSDGMKAFASIMGGIDKCIYVYGKLVVHDTDALKKGWWMSLALEADNGWRNPADMYFVNLMTDSNLTGVEYEEGVEYDIILPCSLSHLQVTEKEYNNAQNWNYRLVFSVNPIIYMDLEKDLMKSTE